MRTNKAEGICNNFINVVKKFYLILINSNFCKNILSKLTRVKTNEKLNILVLLMLIM